MGERLRAGNTRKPHVCAVCVRGVRENARGRGQGRDQRKGRDQRNEQAGARARRTEAPKSMRAEGVEAGDESGKGRGRAAPLTSAACRGDRLESRGAPLRVGRGSFPAPPPFLL